MPLLELRDLQARYGHVRALHGITLTLDDGEIAVVLGANGAGKTTLLRAVSGTVRTSGDVVFEGSKLYRRTPEGTARRGIAHVPDRHATLAAMTVLDNLRVGAWTQRGASGRDLAHVFELFPVLYDRRDAPAGLLARGDQQLLALGRALMAKPRLLLVDEPSRGLAPATVRDLFATLRALSERGTSVLVAEQLAAAALDVARRAYVLDAGRVVLAGSPSDLRRNETVRRVYLGY